MLGVDVDDNVQTGSYPLYLQYNYEMSDTSYTKDSSIMVDVVASEGASVTTSPSSNSGANVGVVVGATSTI